MKASELRIGNYISGGRVIHTHKNGFIEYEVEDGISCGSSGEMTVLNPIPLTEEWLLRFGFVHQGTCDDFMNGYYRNERLPDICFDNDFQPAVTGNDWGPTYLMQTEMKYVHQLQNFYFALTGEELTVK